MTYEEVMSELESMGTAQNRKIYKRHGAGENMFGVSFANLNKLKKQIKTDHELAVKLWKSGNVDAMSLATMIADPKKMSQADADVWMNDIDYYLLADVFAGNIMSKTDFAENKMNQWIESDDEWIGRVGWSMMAHFAMADNEKTDVYFNGILEKIEKEIHSKPNYTRHSMNSALIAIGTRNHALKELAISTAKRIGKVEVDHGETSCKTPEAIQYIEKTWNRKQKRK